MAFGIIRNLGSAKVETLLPNELYRDGIGIDNWDNTATHYLNSGWYANAPWIFNKKDVSSPTQTSSDCAILSTQNKVNFSGYSKVKILCEYSGTTTTLSFNVSGEKYVILYSYRYSATYYNIGVAIDTVKDNFYSTGKVWETDYSTTPIKVYRVWLE